jgi:hypothetical protein
MKDNIVVKELRPLNALYGNCIAGHSNEFLLFIEK